MNKRGQVAIFVIIALVIVGVILAVLFYPRISELVAPGEFNSEKFLQSCIQPEVRNAITLLSKQGGYQNPQGVLTYEGNKVKYLCYTEGYYKTCTVQQPMIKSHFEQEVAEMVNPRAEGCFENLKSEYEKRGYSVTGAAVSDKIEIVPGKVSVEYNAPLTISKDNTIVKRDTFVASVDSEMYDILMISHSIVDFEATYGDSEITAFTQYYPDLVIKKIKLEDGVKVYKVSNVLTEEEFVFATRSLVWPAGYGA